MDGWMDRWMDGQMDGWTDGQMDGQMFKLSYLDCSSVLLPKRPAERNKQSFFPQASFEYHLFMAFFFFFHSHLKLTRTFFKDRFGGFVKIFFSRTVPES